MTVGQKASLSLLISVLLFAAFAVASFSGLFNFLESRFYNPAVTRQYDAALDATAKAVELYNSLNVERFASVLDSDAIKRSFLPNLSAQDAFERANTLGKLQEETPGLSGLRLIDQGGKRIHFSSFPADILRRTDTETLFRDYGQNGELAYADIAAPEGSNGLLRVEESSGRLIFSLPFHDSFGVYRGSAVFSLSATGLLDALVKSGLVQVGEQATPAGAHGLLFRAPSSGRDALAARVAEAWSEGLGTRPLTLSESVVGSSWVLFSRETARGFRIGMVLPSSNFSFPAIMRILLLGVFLVTAFLLVFLVLNLRQDRTTVIAERIKRYHIGMLEASFSEKADRDLGRWTRQLEARREEYKKAIKTDLGKLGEGKTAEADALIDKSWDEILAVLGRRVDESERIGGASIKEIERLITAALSQGNFVLPASSLVSVPDPGTSPAPPRPAARKKAVPTPPKPLVARQAEPADAEVLKELEAEAVEELEEVEELEAEEVEEAEAVEELEAEEVEEAEAVEELEAEEVEEAEAVEELEAEEVEEAEAVEELEAEEVEEAEAVE
ncbi:MAG: hypothetical protein WCL50_04360, partial [Spirochaetota bacterium]